jgi:hypothetical protein
LILECTVEPAVHTVYGLLYRWGLREALAAYVLVDTSTYKEKRFSAKVVHKVGMGAALVMLRASLRPGNYDKFVQFGTVQKFRSGFSDAYHASAEGQEAVVMAKDTRKLTVTKCPRFKGETGETYHLMPIVNVTNRGLEPRKWSGRLLKAYEDKGIKHGPLFRGKAGGRMKPRELETRFFERLEYIKELSPHLFISVDDIRDEYGIHRSLRRGATSEAVNAGVTPHVIDANN